MDQDLENLWLDRYVLSAPQIEDILRGWQETRDELADAGTAETRADMEGQISELESDVRDARNERDSAEEGLAAAEKHIADLEARVAELEQLQ